MTNHYFVVNHNDTSVTIGTAATTKTHGSRSGVPQKIALTLGNLPKKKGNTGAVWPRTPSKIDPQVGHPSRLRNVTAPVDHIALSA